MNMPATLTARESEVAELFAWGASKKEVADMLSLSQRTVENHARHIYEKTRCGKVNELSAWWFCTRFNISFDLSPLKCRAMATVMTLLLLPQIFTTGENAIRPVRTRTRPAAVETFRVLRRRMERDGVLFETSKSIH